MTEVVSTASMKFPKVLTVPVCCETQAERNAIFECPIIFEELKKHYPGAVSVIGLSAGALDEA